MNKFLACFASIISIVFVEYSCSRSKIQANTSELANVRSTQDDIKKEREKLRNMDTVLVSKIKRDSIFWHKKKMQLKQLRDNASIF